MSKLTLALTGPDIEQDTIVVEREGLTVGRVPGNDLTLPKPQISRSHCRFIWQDGGFWVEDLGSSNGTWVEGERIEPHTPHPLKEGTSVRTGPFTFEVVQIERPQPVETKPVSEPAVATPPKPPAPPEPSHPLAENILDVVKPPPPPEPLGIQFDEDGYPFGIPRDESTWLQYLPALYSDDGFTGRYLLIPESIMRPLMWMLDNFDMYLDPQTTPAEWLPWFASWFDLILAADLPEARQRSIIGEAGWLFRRRGTRVALERLLELTFEVTPEIDEEPCHFTVKLPLGKEADSRTRQLANQLIMSQKPAFADYTLEIV